MSGIVNHQVTNIFWYGEWDAEAGLGGEQADHANRRRRRGRATAPRR